MHSAYRWLGLFAVCAALAISAPAGAGTPCTNIEKLECALGEYTITKIEQYRGGLTPERAQLSYLKSPVYITRTYFKYRSSELHNPEYRVRLVTLPTEEGDIGPEDVSTFWGYEMGRKKVVVIEVYAAGRIIADFEVISPSRLWFGFDGYYFEATR